MHHHRVLHGRAEEEEDETAEGGGEVAPKRPKMAGTAINAAVAAGNGGAGGGASEPTSVLYRRSPSPPSSSSSTAAAAFSQAAAPAAAADDWAAAIGGDDWEAVLSSAAAGDRGSQDHDFLRWIFPQDAGAEFSQLALDPVADAPPPPLSTGPLPPTELLNRREPVLLPSALLAPPPPGRFDFFGVGGLQLDPVDSPATTIVSELVDTAAGFAEAGDIADAHAILARLNHRLPSSPTALPPILRTAFHFKEALVAAAGEPLLPSSPLDIALKLSAHKAFSEVSPLSRFAAFTGTQALLDELGGAARRVHIVDFDVYFGDQWPSFMQELAHQWQLGGATEPPPAVRITAVVSPGSHHPLELRLTGDNLTQFAASIGIDFEFSAVVATPFDLSPVLAAAASHSGEATAVSLTINPDTRLPLRAVLRCVRQLRPRLMLSTTHWSSTGSISGALHNCTALLDSIDAAGTAPDASSLIEQFVVRPGIEGLGRRRRHSGSASDVPPPWRAVFTSAGYVSVPLSDATDTQASWLVRRSGLQGFHVEKSRGTMSLWWLDRELTSVSAWRPASVPRPGGGS